MDKAIIELFEKQHRQEELSDSDIALMNQLKKNNEYESSKSLFEDFFSAMEVFGTQQLKSDMEEWRFEDDIAEMNQQAHIAPSETELDFENIPEAALEAHFAESPSYATAIRASNRNAGIEIVSPLNGFDWNQQPFSFEIKGLGDNALKFQVEDNLNDPILNGPLTIEDNKFSIDLNWEKTHPGRYYLKVFTEKSIAIVEFFIRKDLMP